MKCYANFKIFLFSVDLFGGELLLASCWFATVKEILFGEIRILWRMDLTGDWRVTTLGAQMKRPLIITLMTLVKKTKSSLLR